MFSIILISAAMDIFCRTPDDFEVKALNLSPETEMGVFLFHGAQDQLNPELSAIAEKFTELLDFRDNLEVVNYDWSFGSSFRLRASTNALKVGESLGNELAAMKNLKYLRLIGHSAGAYIPDALCRAYRNGGGLAHIEITFLDAFGMRGFVDRGYGARNHGSCADFALNIVNTDDAAPTTNSYLNNAWNLDVTGLLHPTGFILRQDPRTGEIDPMLKLNSALDDVTRNLNDSDHQQNGHYWPPYYFLEILDQEMASPAARNHEKFPRGEFIMAPSLLSNDVSINIQ